MTVGAPQLTFRQLVRTLVGRMPKLSTERILQARKKNQAPYDPAKFRLLLRAEDKVALAQLEKVLRAHDGNASAAARDLQLPLRTLQRFIEQIPAVAEVYYDKAKGGLDWDPELTWEGVTLTREEWRQKLGLSRAAWYKRLAAGKRGPELFAPKAKPRGGREA